MAAARRFKKPVVVLFWSSRLGPTAQPEPLHAASSSDDVRREPGQWTWTSTTLTWPKPPRGVGCPTCCQGLGKLTGQPSNVTKLLQTSIWLTFGDGSR